MKKLPIFVCLFLTNCCICAKLPSTFKKCDRSQSDFNQCLRIAVEDAIRQLNRPIRNLGLNNLDPIEIPSLNVRSRSRSVAFQQKYKNFKLLGLSDIYLLDLDMNFESKTLYMDCLFPEIKWEFDYDFEGSLLESPVKGTGPGHVAMGNVRYMFTFTLDDYVKNGKKYFKVVGIDSMLKPGSIEINLENLSDISKMVNDNWKMLWDDVRPGYEDAFGEIFSRSFNSLLDRVSIEDIFESESSSLAPSFKTALFLFNYRPY